MAGYKRSESVLVVVHDPDGRFLLLKRSDIDDFWQSVTGSLHWGESAAHAAVRELQEETGIVGPNLRDWCHSETFRILDEFRPRYAPETEHNLEHMFSIEVDRNQPVRLDPNEHAAYVWKPVSEAKELVWSWSNRDAIAAVAKKYRWL